MELLNEKEITSIVKQYGLANINNWFIENYADQLIGYLGDHLRLKIDLDTVGVKSNLNLFVKCIPRFDKWKSNYLKESNFFKKEFVMLHQLFKEFGDGNGVNKWRPKLLFAREDLFVFEDVKEIGYEMPSHRTTMSFDEIIATVRTLAKFHAQSYIYEEMKSKELERPYRIWEEYSDYLHEPQLGQKWRDAGRNAVIEYLKVYSSHKNKSNFSTCLQVVVPMLFEGALTLMKPSSIYRNVVIHRDLWSNNILLKKQSSGDIHAMIVDFQTVLYSSPMLDLSSLLFFNTSRSFRNKHTVAILDFYYRTLHEELKSKDLDIREIFDESTLMKSYDESIMFGITQAALIVPIIAMSTEKREELFSNPETCAKINEVSRSDEFIEIAGEDAIYRTRITELLDEIVERYIFLETNSEEPITTKLTRALSCS